MADEPDETPTPDQDDERDDERPDPGDDPRHKPTSSRSYGPDEVARIVESRLAKERSKLGGLAHDEVVERLRKLDELEEASKTELEKAVDRTRKETEQTVRSEVESVWKGRFLRAEVKSAAVGLLADPEDAVLLLDLDAFEVSDDGSVDPKAISKAIEKLLERKPHLAANGARRGVNFDAGPRTPAPSGSEDINARLRRLAGRT